MSTNVKLLKCQKIQDRKLMSAALSALFPLLLTPLGGQVTKELRTNPTFAVRTWKKISITRYNAFPFSFKFISMFL